MAWPPPCCAGAALSGCGGSEHTEQRLSRMAGNGTLLWETRKVGGVARVAARKNGRNAVVVRVQRTGETARTGLTICCILLPPSVVQHAADQHKKTENVGNGRHGGRHGRQHGLGCDGERERRLTAAGCARSHRSPQRIYGSCPQSAHELQNNMRRGWRCGTARPAASVALLSCSQPDLSLL